MWRVFVFLIFVCGAAMAADDAAVMDAYREYAQAVEEGDKRAIRRLAADAYEVAEREWGDSRKETGLIATNYAVQLELQERWGAAHGIYQRCVEILAQFPEALAEEAQCRLGSAATTFRDGETEEARAELVELIDIAEPLAEEGNWAAQITGEAYLRLTFIQRPPPTRNISRGTIASGDTSSRIERQPGDDVVIEVDMSGADYARKSVRYLEMYSMEPRNELAQAYRVAGNFAELESKYEEARAYYQQAYEMSVALFGEEDETTIAMSGRIATVELELLDLPLETAPARKPSGEKCKVVVRGGSEIEVCINKRWPPYFPNKSLFKGQQGFSLAKYDITLEGKTENISIVHSWPGGIFDERAIEAIEKWSYFPPTDENGENVRAPDVYTQITYIIE